MRFNLTKLVFTVSLDRLMNPDKLANTEMWSFLHIQ